jgi:hypothetical protein
MQEKSKKYVNMLIVLAIIAALFTAGYFYVTRDQSGSATLTSDSTTGAPTVLDKEFITALRDLKKVTLDEGIFSHPVWGSLSDFGKTLIPQTPGRKNPFAPLGLSSEAFGTTSVR